MGGNVQLGDQSASRIDLKSSSRTSVVALLLQSLKAINLGSKNSIGLPLWEEALFKSLGFLSGSARHFFSLNDIDDKSFVSVKPSVGDIDTQVPLSMEPLIEKFLNSSVGKTFGDLTLIGFKKSAGQFITLWDSKTLKYNIQIDLEMVDFEDGKPTKWSDFSHSSAWNDMKLGLKGVAHKYLLRALSTKSLRDIVLLKGKTKKPTVVTSTDLAFSVMKGLREKLKPVLDSSGKIVKTNGLDTYEEIPTKDSTYVTDIDLMFKMLFGHMPSSEESKSMWSFVGIIDLVKKYWSTKDQSSLALGFGNTLWGPGAQGLYRGDPAKDLDEKTAMFDYLVKNVSVSKETENTVNSWKSEYYRNYK